MSRLPGDGGGGGRKNNNKKNNKWKQKAGAAAAAAAEPRDHKRLSHKLSSVLRHRAVEQGLAIGADGYVSIEALLRCPGFERYTKEDVLACVEDNWLHSKGRFSVSADGLRVRANQGHTIACVDAEALLTAVTDPAEVVGRHAQTGRYECVHGTFAQNERAIKNTEREREERPGDEHCGLSRMARQHVHFARGRLGEDGVRSGMRPSANLLLWCDMEAAMQAGIKFYVSANGVLLSPGNRHGVVPSRFLRVERL